MRRILLWLTTPNLLLGLALGVCLSILAAMVWQLDLAESVAAVLLGGAFLLLIGAVVGHTLAARGWNRFREQSMAPARTLLSEIARALAQPDASSRSAALSVALPQAAERLQPVAESLVGVVLRFFAIGRLFALLGVTVSFAVFLATYMQVERLAEQNALVRLQSLSAHQQIAQSMRGEIAAARSLEALAHELLSIYRKEDAARQRLSGACASASAELKTTFAALGHFPPELAHERECFKHIAELLQARSASLQANRLLNQQVTGSAMRLSLFSRDLTEQFTTQFTSVCGTQPERTSTVGRRWTALNQYEEPAVEIVKYATGGADDTVFLSGTPPEQATAATQNLLSLTGEQATTVAELGKLVLTISQDVEDYLAEQHHACATSAADLIHTLVALDNQYRAMLPPEPAATTAPSSPK